jgi:uncharacterized membrane protein YhaH (DUF805 family)
VAGIVVAWKDVPRWRALWTLAAFVAAMMLVDFALDEERWSDLPFFVVVGLVLFGLAALARWITLRFRPEPVGRVAE